ncbi:MAG: hypothetical protein OJF49_003437 [Ktedonobacterales bacterium]|nr:MAG: hypothetical protein OJF49_003437 [Ktedonobacterales bacterium]
MMTRAMHSSAAPDARTSFAPSHTMPVADAREQPQTANQGVRTHDTLVAG